jgi:hypothetical protein
VETRVILLDAAAPAKPAAGAQCNGCGVCCASEPCPLGVLVTRRRQGACTALLWEPGDMRYRCALASRPTVWLAWLPAALASRLAKRRIAAGRGCDCELEPD